MKLSRRASAATALAALTIGGTVAATAPASAAPSAPAAAYNGVCGTGYKVIDSTPVGNVGTVYLTWNESTGKNCAVTIRNTPGAKILMSVKLEIPELEDTWASDADQYTTYAGPVYLSSRGYCVQWTGQIGTASGSDYGHCG
ncbi:spore-associated protein A [Streptomyces sp. S.PNR 29]|uniref:spore-associated protein A n=1 Tax=Streptomyces sp. S.PNR 29 TaxID=2973805 RepID=UPI0025AF48FD|nr:spore-associated protein A [Streptomyces sp. S.PNR 29]MDN0193429.1 spore-associated protein A [Streptomyces sp. S.PNR 29]